jgi:hypothetical protein
MNRFDSKAAMCCVIAWAMPAISISIVSDNSSVDYVEQWIARHSTADVSRGSGLSSADSANLI